ncbi:cellobiose phosphorylase [Candidatus Amarolinea aalborgensis]|uniref:cellobiose phosphorylase n=1 Tax=Candidatus Amarolinea aalborgensis TaxID=2249329 RepID=UPI003BF9D829
MKSYHFDPLDRFVIEDYDTMPPFSSFLPGIAGPLGIPLWAFYVNRGQAIASFGVGSKDMPIMEFQPANKAYQMAPYTGFRTFIKRRDAAGECYYEPFSALIPASSQDAAQRSESVRPSRRMSIGPNELELEETSAAHGLRTTVLYFTLSGEPFAGLVRQVTVTNVGAAAVTLDLLDGLPIVIPFGINDRLLKDINRTAEAWMAVTNLENDVPFYRVQASVGDEAQVEAVEAGNFYLAFADGPGLPGLGRFVDPTIVFGTNTALSFPDRFLAHPLAELQTMRQITVGRTPCGMGSATATLAPGEAMTLYAIVGHASDVALINRARGRLSQPAYIAAKRTEAQALARSLSDPIATQTSDPRFDAYCRQSLLDNTLRGGWPVRLGRHIYHLYGRKHGDLERDYNAFYLAPEFYSQGNANYRDVAQNRRSNVLLKPAIGDFDVLAFLGLIQADGYNPLVVNGSRFTVPPDRQGDILKLARQPADLAILLGRPFTPGGLLQAVTDRGIGLTVSPQEFIAAVLTQADASFEATFGEGYWVDHWFYILDLLDGYLAVYPDHQDELLFGKPVAPYFDSPAFVQPRAAKTVLADHGKVRQYGAVIVDDEKAALIAARRHTPNLARTAHGLGEVYRTTVFAKLLGLAVIKFATLDPLGMGIEMEAGKPGWCDALNGLPGLFGSSLSETYELGRLLDFLLAALAEKGAAGGSPVEQADLLRDVGAVDRVSRYATPIAIFVIGMRRRRARGLSQDRTRLGFDGRTETIDFATLTPRLALRDKVASGIARAEELTAGIPPTYSPTKPWLTTPLPTPAAAAGGRSWSARGARGFRAERLPPFEGPMHALKPKRTLLTPAPSTARSKKALYDRKLGMYKANAPLEACSRDRLAAHSRRAGWKTNRSSCMAYKYLLEVLRAGLCDEFFTDAPRLGAVSRSPHLRPQPVENSSFLVSSAHPDESLHGRGFVARLTGAAAEFISIWSLMMAGPRPFFMQDGDLCLAFRPALPGWLFREDGALTFTFLGQCEIVYHKPPGAGDPSTVTAVKLHLPAGQEISLPGGLIGAPYAAMVRSGEIKHIEMTLSEKTQ